MDSALEQTSLQLIMAIGVLLTHQISFINVLIKAPACKYNHVIIERFFRGGINSECNTGYTGKMCNSCLKQVNGTYYARSGVNQCTECEELWI